VVQRSFCLSCVSKPSLCIHLVGLLMLPHGKATHGPHAADRFVHLRVFIMFSGFLFVIFCTALVGTYARWVHPKTVDSESLAFVPALIPVFAPSAPGKALSTHRLPQMNGAHAPRLQGTWRNHKAAGGVGLQGWPPRRFGLQMYAGSNSAEFPLNNAGGMSAEQDETPTVSTLDDALGSLKIDIPQALIPEDDPRRTSQTNWAVYADAVVTGFLLSDPEKIDPVAKRLLEVGGITGAGEITGKSSNVEALEKVRKIYSVLRFSKMVDGDDITVDTHMNVDPSTGDKVIEARWIATIPMKRLQKPKWMSRATTVRKPDKRIIKIEAVSKFYLNEDDMIYRQLIDEIDLLVDEEKISSRKVSKFLDIVTKLPLPRFNL